MSKEMYKRTNNIKKEQKGITLIPFVMIIMAIILAAGIGTYVILNLREEKKPPNTIQVDRTQAEKQEGNKNNVNLEEVKTKKYPDLFGENKLPLRPPQIYKVGVFYINKNNNPNIVTRSIQTGRNDNLEFAYVIDEGNSISVTIENNSKIISDIDKYITKETTTKETVNEIDIYTDRTKFDINKICDFYTFIKNNEKRYTVKLYGKYQAVKEYIKEIIEAIEFTGNEAIGIEAISENLEIGKYKFSFSKNAYAYNWYLNKPQNKDNMVYIKYTVPTENKDSSGYGYINYADDLYIYNRTYNFESLKESIEKDNRLYEGISSKELVKVPIDGYEFYVEKNNDLTQNKTYYVASSIYLIIDEQVVKFSLDAKSYENIYSITEENMVIDIINKQIINQVLFLK